ncbi:hypothetical protein M5119_10770 [Lacticaseibacillus paracasei]|jgi:hypothetical protein|uniref:Uncharacterized protein n=1 Tax=Lacticaseibacillus paracasei subsp. paracasei Lpp41 TaxID=1256208 RepID=A0A829H4F1_LACPA|nr:hypothetical protein [Lacticaseibacillus paracasei]EPC71273.1 hypothetical protein Lpp41_12193 [Lacticaseibacillus paracasei subsp. paracasei Lpp41]MBU6045410.1 hypothetical protein [Lacticaseibacillus paracasei]MBU6048115.1 hypothetical protein [Lacticaseibacillus paracasei]MCL4970232.1 hypothetical protein [Lacticaseibacillus paracasei]MCL4972879.1 hypothetical protein [Lacticaseibacillus paracasei]
MENPSWKKVLKIILKMPEINGYDHERDLSSIYGCDYHHQVSVLRSMNLVSKETKLNGFWEIDLTDLGFTYFDRSWDKTLEFVRRSILVPIAVSITTTLLAWLLKWIIFQK